MRLVLLSGGSGKRLWPLSNDSRSKQFLRVLRNEENDQLESMVQRVWRQLANAGLADRSYIATGKGQLEMIQSQVGADTPVIIEPNRRDTFPAIALAAVYLYSMEGVGLNEIVSVLPVDPYVESSFFQKVLEMEEVLQQGEEDLALLGVEPTYPSEKYGYIVPDLDAGSNNSNRLKVKRFAEKPNEATAKQLIESRALWNCGVFAFRLSLIINLLIERGLPIQYEELSKNYHLLPKISFDYEVVEKLQNITVLPYAGFWKDLGTWNTLTEEMDVDVLGNGMVCEDSVNTHIVNELDIPVAVLGLSNIVVSASPDGILVSDKSTSPKVKELINHMDQRPMYEERRWGSYRVLDYQKYPEGREVLTKRICIAAGKNLSYQMHTMRNEIWTIVSGSGEYVMNGELHKVRVGDVVQVPAMVKHSIRAIEDLEIIEVQTGSELIEEDIHRFYMDWSEIIDHALAAR